VSEFGHPFSQQLALAMLDRPSAGRPGSAGAREFMIESLATTAIVKVRTTCCMDGASGCGGDPRICTRREAKSMTNTV